jgi:hypothetical protein
MESQNDNPALLKVAQAVSDGKAVDWEAEKTRQDDAAKELAQLRELETVAAGYRATPPPRAADRLVPEGPQAGKPPAAKVSEAAATPQAPAGNIPSWMAIPAPLRRWRAVALALIVLYLLYRFLWKT